MNDKNQATLINDVFRGQLTDPVTQALKNNTIILVKIPPGVTHIYQSLDLTVDHSPKTFFKYRFKWYSNEILKQLHEGKHINDQVEVLLHLSVLKSLRGKWIIEFCYDMTNPKGKDVIVNGRKSSNITEALERGKNPFGDLDPLGE